MDKISGFSDDELLVKILSFLPTKVAVKTSILSKQWKFLWMRVPKLDYDDISIYMKRFNNSRRESEESQRMRSFINKNLPLHSSPVIQSLYLRFFTASFQPEDIKLWVEIAVSRSVQELTVKFDLPKGISNCALLSSSLYTCESLVTLKLRDRILVDVPHGFCLPSLKTLHLERVIYADEESLQRLISNSSSVLEDLIVEQRRQGENVRKFDVVIPSLLSLSIAVSGQCSYVIDTPSLKYFKAKHISKIPSSCLIGNMPKLEEANITAALWSKTLDIKKLIKPVTSVKRLSLCILNSIKETVYCDDSIFKELEHLNLKLVNSYWSKLVFWLLKASPKLRDLNCEEQFSLDDMDTLVCWKQQTGSVPQCLLSSLQTFKWSGYPVSVEGRDLATYILRNSCLLKTAKFSIGPGMDPQKKLEMETEVINSCRGSPTCNLVFD